MVFGGWGGGGGGGRAVVEVAVDSDPVVDCAAPLTVGQMKASARPTTTRSWCAFRSMPSLTNGAVIIAIFGTIVFSFASYTQPAIIGRAIDFAKSGNVHDLTIAGIELVGLALLSWLSYYGYMSTTAWMGHRILLTLRRQMFAHLQKLSLSFYDRNEVGRVMSRVQNDVTSLQELLTSGFFTVLADFLGLSVILFWMFSLDWRLALLTMAVLPLLVLVLWWWQERAKKAFIQVRQAISIVNTNLQENISGYQSDPEPEPRRREHEAVRQGEREQPERQRRSGTPHRHGQPRRRDLGCSRHIRCHRLRWSPGGQQRP